MQIQVDMSKAKWSTVEYKGEELEILNMPGVAAMVVHCALNPNDTNDNGLTATTNLKKMTQHAIDFDKVFMLAMLNDQPSIRLLQHTLETALHLAAKNAQAL